MADLSKGLPGDVGAAQVPVVEVDNTQFSLAAGAGNRVPIAAVMTDQLEAAPPGNFLGPYAADTQNNELIWPQMSQVIPTKYAATSIHRDGVSPSTAYQELSGIFETGGVLEACADVLAWLRVACMACGGAGDLTGTPAVAQPFTLLVALANRYQQIRSGLGLEQPRLRWIRWSVLSDMKKIISVLLKLYCFPEL